MVRFRAVRVSLLVAVFGSLASPSPNAFTANQQAPAVDIVQGIEIVEPLFLDAAESPDGASPRVVLRNKHSIWYAVQTIDHQRWVLLPPCQTQFQADLRELVDYDCSESTVDIGRIPLTPGYRWTGVIDGAGGTPAAGERLAFIYVWELMWRAALGEPLPPTSARKLESLAFGFSDAALENSGKIPLASAIRSLKALKEQDYVEAADAAADFVSWEEWGDLLVKGGIMSSAQAERFAVFQSGLSRFVLGIQLGILWPELVLRFGIEAVASGGATEGILEFHVPGGTGIGSAGLALGDTESPVIPLGKFGLQWLPDTHVSFLRANDNLEVYITSRVESYRFEGRSFADLQPAPSDHGRAVPILNPTGAGFASDYAGLGTVLSGSALSIPDPHFRLGFFHAEQCDRSNYTASVGMATSSDDGRSWTIAGRVITGRDPAPRCQQVTGAGQPSALVTGGYVYVYYTDWAYTPGATDVPATIHVARAPIGSATDPTAYQKFDNGNWTPGLGGSSSPVIRPPSDSPLYAANVGVSYNSILRQYLATVETNNGFGYATSVDALNWTPVRLFARFPIPQYPTPPGATWYSYPSLLDESATDSQTTRENVNLYYSVGIQGLEPHYMVRRSVKVMDQLAPSINLPRPILQTITIPHKGKADVPANFACQWDNKVNGVQVYDDDPTTAIIQVTNQPVTLENQYYPNGAVCLPSNDANIDLLRLSMPTGLRRVDIVNVPGGDLQNRVRVPKGKSTRVPAGYVCPGDSYYNNAKVFDDKEDTAIIAITRDAVSVLNIYGDLVCLEATDKNVATLSRSAGSARLDTISVPGGKQPGATLAPPP